MRNIKQHYNKLYAILLVLLLMGCTTKFVNEQGTQLPPGLGYAVQALEQAKNIYDPIMTTIGKMHCDGKITNEQAWKVIKSARIFKISIDALRVGIMEWKLSIDNKRDTEPPKFATYTHLIELSRDAIVLLNDYNAITGKKIKIPDILTEDSIKFIFGEVK